MQIRKKTIVCMLLFILFVGNAVAQNLITNVSLTCMTKVGE